MKSGGDSPKVETMDKGQRGLRWTKHETLTLVTAKQNELEKSLGSTSRGIDVVDVKWVTIFRDCKEAGVERDASQCRKRWHSLYKEYRKVKEYETMRGNSKSYWMLNSEQRREKKLASFFEQEVFEALENYSRILPAAAAAAPRVTVDAFRANNEEFESLQEDEEAPENANSSEDGGVGCSRPETGAEESPSGRKKKKRKGDPIEERLLSALESGTQKLQLQWVHDRELRKEQGKLFFRVLDQLVHTIGRMADAMEVQKS